ncbi:lachesin [Cryptotermes secundus]|uniref:lachesin n=1 Tax=Cryptotermes secundus TaxID=105785 RepID=UPI001454BCA1|nr:lachesin [Cryptotermes secundus]
MGSESRGGGGRLLIICALLAAYVAGQMSVMEPEPEFLQPLENHTVTQGRDVFFTCVVNHLGPYKVAWIKSDSKAILAIQTHMVAHNPRLSVTHNGHNTWKLHVSNVQINDCGTYMCQINTDPMRSQMGNLDVKVPPDILNDESPDGGVAPENSSVRLRCKATGIPEPTVMWRREDSRNIILRHDGGREKEAVRSYDGETLFLNSIQRADMGAYLCIANNGIPPPVSKRFVVQVQFQPSVKVSNQLVAAPAGSNVDIGCDVEASPKAMNSWFRETGEKLMESGKYEIKEVPINDYSLHMNLKILNVQKHDFGTYVCASVNALGKVEGSVRLQELHLAPKTTTVPVSARHDNKPRKKTAPHSKDSKRKRKRPKGDRREEEDASGEDDEDSEPVTTGPWPEPRTVQTIIPSAGRPPSSNPHRNGADNVSSGSPSYGCGISSVRLPLWATAVIVVQVALKHLLNYYHVTIF